MSTSRRPRLVGGLAVAALLLSAGCMGIGDLGGALDLNRAEKVSYSAEVVGEAPDEATVVDADDLGNASQLTSLFSEAVESDEGYASYSVRGSDAENITGAMSEFSFHEDAGAFYFEYDGTTLRVTRLE
jgi:hypothetical protein